MKHVLLNFEVQRCVNALSRANPISTIEAIVIHEMIHAVCQCP